MCWLATMELALHHPGFGTRMAADAAVALICVLGIVAGTRSSYEPWQRWLAAPAAILIAFGANVFVHNLRGPGFEGFALLISALVVLDGVLLLAQAGRKL
jgi:hypothetical protein